MLFDRVAQSDNSTRSAAHFPLDSQTPFTGSSKGPYLVPRTELLVGTGVSPFRDDAFEEWAAGRFLDLLWSAGGGCSSAAENPLYQVKARPRVIVTAGKCPRLLLWVAVSSRDIGDLS
jgi:hypothetical protein